MKGHEDGGMFFGQEEKSVSYFCRHDPEKGGDPAAGSPTATLLRLHPSR